MTKILTVLTLICTASAASAADVIVRLYSGTTTDQYTDYPVESGEEAVNNRAWNASRPVAFYVHGIEESINSESTTTIVDAFLKHGDYNVMAINYAFQAKYSGFLPRALAFLVIQSAVVGESMGQLLYRLVAKGVPVSSFYLIGYSIGAHIAGHAARSVGRRIPRITALDPILHGWFLFSIDDHLWKTDAEVVDVIHSNGVVMGVSTALGTADFYPNNGYALQPGCPVPVNVQSVLCSSDVAWKWFAESVNNPKAFKAIGCNSWAEFKARACKGETDHMGYGHSENTTGVFYLQTNGASPYSKGNNGIIYDGSADTYLVSGADDVFVRFYNGTTPNDYTDYAIQFGEETVTNNAWNSSNPVAIYVHGMNENVDSEGPITVAAAFLKRGGWNVIAINCATQLKYSDNIINAFAHLVTQSGVVGEILANLLNRFTAAGVPASSFYLIGYSIGAHVVGHGARIALGTFPRITALDPQLHGWFLFSLDDHLWSTDATSVEVIHTNGILMGVSTALGTVDFYPNSGYALQPGCSYSFNSELFYCSSDVSWKYFAESVINPTAFKAISCNSWTEFETGKCTGPIDYMGFGFSQKANGTFYLQTNSKSSYSKGDSGIIYDASTMGALSATVLEWLASILKYFLG